jgi:glycosyltransferase involved in cell wall biosynthesis
VPLLTLITAVSARNVDYLADTIRSVQIQELPAGWELEWIVQEDGALPVLADHFALYDVVRYAANNAQLGIAVTRNFGLARASGGLIRVLDSDDILLPASLSTIIPHFQDHGIHWAVGQADDLMPNGERLPWKSALPYGRVKAGLVNQWAEEHEGNWPIHCAGLTMRTESVRALGGWAGLPNDEDIVLFAALSEITDGYNDEAVTWLYRQHPDQATRTEEWRSYSANGRTAALQRARTMRTLGIRLTYHEAVDDVQDDFQIGPAVKYGISRRQLEVSDPDEFGLD